MAKIIERCENPAGWIVPGPGDGAFTLILDEDWVRPPSVGLEVKMHLSPDGKCSFEAV